MMCINKYKFLSLFSKSRAWASAAVKLVYNIILRGVVAQSVVASVPCIQKVAGSNATLAAT